MAEIPQMTWAEIQAAGGGTVVSHPEQSPQVEKMTWDEIQKAGGKPVEPVAPSPMDALEAQGIGHSTADRAPATIGPASGQAMAAPTPAYQALPINPEMGYVPNARMIHAAESTPVGELMNALPGGHTPTPAPEDFKQTVIDTVTGLPQYVAAGAVGGLPGVVGLSGVQGGLAEHNKGGTVEESLLKGVESGALMAGSGLAAGAAGKLVEGPIAKALASATAGATTMTAGSQATQVGEYILKHQQELAALPLGQSLQQIRDNVPSLGDMSLDALKNFVLFAGMEVPGIVAESGRPAPIREGAAPEPTNIPVTETPPTNIPIRENQNTLKPAEGQELPSAEGQNPNTPDPAVKGMGGATPEEFKPAPHTMAAKNEAIDADRVARGKEPISPSLKQDFPGAFDQAEKVMEEKPDAQDKLLIDLAGEEKPRPLKDYETVMLVQRRVDLHNTLNDYYEKLMISDAAGTKEQSDTLSADILKHETQMDMVDTILKRTGTAWSAGGRIRQAMMAEDYSLATMLAKERAAKGEPLTPEETKAVTDLNERWKQQKPKVNQAEEQAGRQTEIADAEEPIKQAEQEVKKRQVKERIKNKGKAAPDKPAPEQSLEAIRKGLRESNKEEGGISEKNLSRHANDLLEHFIEQGEHGALHLAGLVHEVLKAEVNPNMTLKEASNAISGYGKYKKLDPNATKKEARQTRRELLEIEKQLDALLSGEAKLTGAEREQPTQKARQLIANTREIMKRWGVKPQDPETAIKTALESAKTRTRHAIDDTIHEISTRERLIKERNPVQPDEELTALREQLAALRKDHEEIFGKPGVTDAQRLAAAEKAAERTLADLQRRVAESDLSPKETRTPVTSDKLEALRAKIKHDQEYLRLLKAIQKPKPDWNLVALQRKKVAMTRRAAGLEDRMDRQDFAPRPKRTVALDSEAMQQQAELKKIEEEFKRRVARQKRRSENWLDRFLRRFKTFRMVGVLSWPTVFAHLSGAAIARIAVRPMEAATMSAVRLIPGVKAIANKAPVWGTGFNVKAEKRAIMSAKQGAKDAYDILFKGKDVLHRNFGKDEHLGATKWNENKIDATLEKSEEFTRRAHAAMKAITFRNEFERSMELQIQKGQEQGVDLDNPLVMQQYATLAFKDGERALMLQDNAVVEGFHAAVNRIATTKDPFGTEWEGKLIAALINDQLPIVKIPTNFVSEVFDYILGPYSGALKSVYAHKKVGIENLSQAHAEIISRELAKGFLGNALIALGYFTAKYVGGFRQPGEDRDEGDPEPLQTGPLGKEWTHASIRDAVQFGATINRVQNSYLNSSSLERQGFPMGVFAATIGLIDEVPYIRQMTQLATLAHSRRKDLSFGAEAKNRIPGAIQWTARQLDRDSKGELVDRKAEGFGDQIATGIPGLRQGVPTK